jgi:thiol-disulfide isomerase/thioredoxin
LSATPDRNVPGRLTRTGKWRFVLCGLLVGICFASRLPEAFAGDSLVNRKAPEFVRKDLSGARLDLKSLRGKIVLLNFWATWCGPCQLEMPVFAKWQQQYGPQGLQVVGISMDDAPAPVRRLVSKLKPNYPVAMGDATLGERYGVLGLPLTYLIGRDGVVRAQFQGETDLSTIEKQLRLILVQR